MTSLGFIGAGMMASAMIRGIVKSKLSTPSDIIVSDVYQPNLDRLVADGVKATQDNKRVVSQSKVVVLAVKPDVIPDVLDEIYESINSEHLVVSIAAGVPLSLIQQRLPEGTRVIRVMPNTPCLVSESAAAYAVGPYAAPEDKQLVQDLLSSVGYACEVKEKQLDAVTGLSGSGPAYVFMLIEAMADGAVRMGLPRSVALQLAAQTVKGAAAMVLETGKHPGELKDQVCSPGGTTIAAVESLEKAGFRGAAMGAVVTATRRSEELAAAHHKKH